MRSFKFPNMLNGNSSNIWNDDERLQATKQNTSLLLSSNRNSLLGDPYFGLSVPLFDQNSPVLEDAISDNIYTQIALFIPQVKVNRKDLKVYRDKKLGVLHCYFTGIDQLDYTTNTYNLTLISSSETQGV